jgi:hypothetical protein
MGRVKSFPVRYRKNGESFFKLFLELQSVNWIFNISVRVHMLLYSVVHFDDSFNLISRQVLLKAEIVFVEYLSISYV